MAEAKVRYRKPLKFVGGVAAALRAMPEDVQYAFGRALMQAQYGDPLPDARPFGEGIPRDVLKLVENDDGETYRAACVVAFEGVVYLLDVFQKKSTSGIGTPRADIARVKARYQAAKQDYAVNKALYLAATAAARVAAEHKLVADRSTPSRVKQRSGNA